MPRIRGQQLQAFKSGWGRLVITERFLKLKRTGPNNSSHHLAMFHSEIVSGQLGKDLVMHYQAFGD